MKKNNKRDLNINIRATKSTVATLDGLSERLNISKADTIELALNLLNSVNVAFSNDYLLDDYFVTFFKDSLNEYL